MKLSRKYLLAEMTGPFLIGLSCFTLVVLLHRFSRLAELVISRGVPARLVGRLLLALLPPFFEITLPASMLLAVLLALGRLSSDSETTALSGAGVGMREVAVPVLIAGAIVFSASLLVAWKGIPWGFRETQRVLARILAERAGAGASEHVFREIAPDVVIYPDHVSPDGRRMGGVFLSFRPPGEEPLLVFAREGSFSKARNGEGTGLELAEGTIHGNQPEKGLYRVASFGRMDFRVPVDEPDALGGDEPKGMTLPQLSERIERTGGVGDGARYRYHFHRRLSLALSCISFGLLAIPLGLTHRARGKSSAFAVTISLVILYYMFIAAAGLLESRSPRGTVAVLWAPNVLGILFSVWILRRSEQRMDFLPARIMSLLEGK
jgi:lipopolysaccharide export system permease protein